MKKISFKTVAFLSATAVLTASCQREEDYYVKGNEVNFNVATGYQNGPATRTEYSGERYTVGSTSYERIDWVAGDVIRIASDKAATSDGASYADYTVQSASPDSEKSIAGVSSSAPLTWGGGTNTFYGLYPAPGVDGVDSGVSFTEAGVATLVLPADQSSITMKYAYMGAATTASAGESVSLEFNPLMNAYCFRLLGDADTGMKLKSLTLSSDECYLVAPSYTVTLNASDNSFGAVTYTEGTASKSITATFGGGDGVDLPTSGDPFTYTIFALPENQTNLRLTLTFISGTTEKTKSFNLTGLNVSAGQKVNISSSNINVPEAWEYTLGSLSPITMEYEGGQGTLASTFVSYRASLVGVVEPVPFRLEYSETGEDDTWSMEPPTWLEMNDGNDLSGSVNGNSLKVDVDKQNNTVDKHHDAMVAYGVANNEDLSLYNPATGERTASRETANCYVVTRPGTYKFPLVYGNGVKGESVNEEAYHARSGYQGVFRTDNYSGFLAYFRDHSSLRIKSPYIVKQLTDLDGSLGNQRTVSINVFNAELYWTDVPGLVQSVEYKEGNAYDGTEATAADDYIQFEVPSDNICQGNALIVLRAGTSQSASNPIAWSWHIWVTDEDLSKEMPLSGNYKFARQNIGWTFTEEYEQRACFVRAVQEESGIISNSVKVLQKAYFVGSSPYYQYGRKDPLPASDGVPSNSGQITDGRDDKKYYDKDGNVLNGTTRLLDYGTLYGPAALSFAIQRPYIHIIHGTSTTTSSTVRKATISGISTPIAISDWCHAPNSTYTDATKQDTFYNLWSSTYGGYACWVGPGGTLGTDTGFQPITKTVYDPSPVGYHIPPYQALATFSEEALFDYDQSINSIFIDSDGDDEFDVGEDFISLAGGRYTVSPALYGQTSWSGLWAASAAAYFETTPYSSSELKAHPYCNASVVVFKAPSSAGGRPEVFSTWGANRSNGVPVRPVQE